MALGLAALTLATSGGCTIITTTGSNDPPPSPRPRRNPHHRPPPPPAPRTPPGPTPAPAPAPGRIAVNTNPGTPDLPPQPAKEDPPSTPTRPSLMTAGVAEGRPDGFTPGAAPAYWIWQGPRGGWRVRTTTKATSHVFRGRITPVATDITVMSPSRTELREQVWKAGSSWHFVFRTAGHADGFTFKTRDNGCVKFDLQLDGGPVPKQIIIGKNQLSPSTNHFILCPHGKKP